MKTTVEVWRVTKPKIERCKESGHSWQVDIPLNRWEVVGSLGVISWHFSEEKAKKVAKEWQEFYDKFPL